MKSRRMSHRQRDRLQHRQAQESRTKPGEVTSITCPRCGGKMVVRVAQTTGHPFLGCDNFPRCTATRNTQNFAL